MTPQSEAVLMAQLDTHWRSAREINSGIETLAPATTRNYLRRLVAAGKAERMDERHGTLTVALYRKKGGDCD